MRGRPFFYWRSEANLFGAGLFPLSLSLLLIFPLIISFSLGLFESKVFPSLFLWDSHEHANAFASCPIDQVEKSSTSEHTSGIDKLAILLLALVLLQ